MSDAIEKVAREVLRDEERRWTIGDDPDGGWMWDNLNDHQREEYLSTARAAIAAALDDMIEPSEGMCATGLRALSDNGVDASTEGASDPDNPHNDALVCWQAMLSQYRKEVLGDE